MSKRAFLAALPATWEARERGQREYGVDYDIDMFRDGQATGIDFCVQIKSTDRLRGKPSVRIKWRTFNYWRDIDRPVLIVLWEATTNRLWWQWTHKFDPYGLDPTTETFSFVFPEDQAWDIGSTANLIENELEAWRAWQNPGGHLPVPVLLTGQGEVAGVAVRRLLGALRLRLQEFSDLLEVRGESQALLRMSIDVNSDRSVLWLSGGPSLTYHHDQSVDSPEENVEAFVDSMTADLTMMISLGLTRFNLPSAAVRLVSEVIEESRLPMVPTIGADLLQFLLEHGRLNVGLPLAKRMLGTQNQGVAFAAVHALGLARDALAPSDKEAVGRALEQWGEAYAEAGQHVKASELIYNAANYIFDLNRQEGIRLLDRAAEHNAQYRERGYWWRERGGALFLDGEYGNAARHYEQACDLEDRRALPLLADALLFSGNYQQALETFRQVVDDEALNKPEWELKYRVFSHLVEWTGINQQTRQPEQASEGTKDQSDPALLRSALNLDMLCSEALFQLGGHARSTGERNVELFAASALVQPLTPLPLPWMHSIVAAAEAESDLFLAIAMCAKRFCGQEILALLRARANWWISAGRWVGSGFMPECKPTPTTQRRCHHARSSSESGQYCLGGGGTADPCPSTPASSIGLSPPEGSGSGVL